MKLKLRVPVTLFVILTFFSQVSYAGYMDIFGFGSREAAMGGAMTAEASGPSAAYYNPAALGKIKGIQTFIGYTYVSPELDINRLGPPSALLLNKNLNGDPFLNTDQPDDIHAISMGLAIPLSKYLVVGTAAHLPAKGPASTLIAAPDRAFYLDYESAPNNIETKVAMAIVPQPWVSVGVGVSILANIEGDILYNFPLAAGIPTPPPSGPLVFNNELEMNWDFGVIAGGWIKPFDFLEVGAAYRQAQNAHVDLDLNVTTDLNSGAGITQFIPISIQSDPIYSPEQVSLGISLKPINRLTVAADVTWVDWSDWKDPYAHLFVGNLGQTTFAGVPFPPGSVRIDTTPIPPSQFQDIYVPRIGLEFRPMEMLFLRAGYYYRESPVPRQAGITNTLDSDTHVFSAGIGTQFDDPLQIIKGKTFIDIHGQLLMLESEENIKVPTLAANDPANEGLPGYQEGGFLWSIGITTGLKF